jgi:thioesterase domain-containing protein
MIGSGVPASLRALGQSVCWVVLLDGERRGTAFSSREEAQECRAAWLAQLSASKTDSLH